MLSIVPSYKEQFLRLCRSCLFVYMYSQSWALILFLYLNTKYFLQMYLNTKYIDVFKYFCKYFFIVFKISSLFIQSIKNLKMNEILDIKLVQLYSMSII